VRTYRANLAAKIGLPVVATTILASLVLSGYALAETTRHVRGQFDVAALRVAGAVEAEFETHEGDPAASQPFLRQVARVTPDLVAVDLVRIDAGTPTVIASSDASDVGTPFTDHAFRSLDPGAPRHYESEDAGQRVLQTTVRFTGVDPATYVVVSMSMESLLEAVGDLRTRVLLAVAAAVLLQVGLLSWLIYRVVIRPLRGLERTALQVAAGRLDVRVRRRRSVIPDEIHAVEAEFNNAVAALEASFARERSDAEKVSRLNDQKTAILNAVSHDLRNPLTALLGAASVLERHDLDDRMRAELVEGIQVSGRKMFRLVDDLLDLDRLERGMGEPDRRDVDVREVLARVVEEERKAGGRDVALACPEGLREFVDPVQLERIVDNLILNAIKHTQGPVEVRADAGPAGLEMTVRDFGPGVPDELKTVVFEPFRTGKGSTGIGIGLSLVARFAEQHGGRAWVEDAPGGGAAFRVELPGSTPAVSSAAASSVAG
jgi:signal transduction histidine kinase